MSCSPNHNPHNEEIFWTVDDIARIASTEKGTDAGRSDTNASALSGQRQPISGTYRGTAGTEHLELRVDLDGTRPMRYLSGDLFKVSGGTVTYFGSFVVSAPAVQTTPSLVTAAGIGKFSFSTTTPFVTVGIARVGPGLPLAAASVTLSSVAGAAGTTFSCAFITRAFRIVQWEQDSIAGTTPFTSYDVASLPSGGRTRVLTVPAAYAEAGIEIQVGGLSNVIPDPGADETWSDAELHASMVDHFSLLADEAQWRVWLLVATAHDDPTARGIMFDRIGRHRQGCAVFNDLVGGPSAQERRAALRTYVHEIGHCFNLVHSFEKSRAVPPLPDRPDALSYMNYVDSFPGGAAAYWAAFPFQFDTQEIRHLRHGFRNDVIMGGSDFGTGAADVDELMVSRPVVDNSGLELRLEGASRNRNALGDVAHRYQLSEPVVVELRLSSYDVRGKHVHEQLHPRYGFVHIIVRQPSGGLKIYRPLADRCIEASFVTLKPDAPMYTSAYIGYGKDGFTFRQPGFYDIRAIYQAPDGSDVVSNILRVRVSSPRNDADEAIADLYFGDDQGKLFTFWGSDAPSLESGNRALQEVIDRYSKHPLAAYALFAKGMNAKRAFKYVTAKNDLHVGKADPAAAVSFLGGATAPAILDNATTNKAMRELAKSHASLGDVVSARTTLDEMVRYFERQRLRRPVLKTIRAQAAETERGFRA